MEYALFPKAIRLVLYATVGIASLAAVPAVITRARSASAMMNQDEANSDAPTVVSGKKDPGTIQIVPVGPNAAARRKAELAALEARLAEPSRGKQNGSKVDPGMVANKDQGCHESQGQGDVNGADGK